MITDTIIDWLFALLRSVLQLLPDWEMPAWLDTLSEPIGTVMGYGSTLGAWVPTQLALTVFSAICVAYLVGFGIKVVRIIASAFTGGGGSAA